MNQTRNNFVWNLPWNFTMRGYLLILTVLLINPVLRAQYHTYSPGENNTGTLVTTSAINLDIASGTATQSGTISGVGDFFVNPGQPTYTGTLIITAQDNLIDSSEGFNVSNGTLNISGGSIGNQANPVVAAYLGYLTTDTTGDLIISNGGRVWNYNGIIAFSAGTNDAVTVTGTGSLWSNSSNLYIGYSSTGSLTISNGGMVTSPFTGVAFAGSFTGVLNLESGGVLATEQVDAGNGEAAFNFDGGILRASGASSDFISNFSGTEVSLLSGGGTIDNNGYNIRINDSLTGTGGATFTGTGTTTLTATSTYSGNTTVNQGTLVVSGITAAITQSSYLDVGETGNAALVVQNGATLVDGGASIGDGTGTFTSTVDISNTKWTNTGVVYVGNQSNGSVTLENGGTMTTGNTGFGVGLYIGENATGTITVTGTGSNLTVGSATEGAIILGENSQGALIVQNGGTVNTGTDSYGGAVWIGDNTGGVGALTVTGTGSSLTAGIGGDGNVIVGNRGNGSVSISSGGVVTDNYGLIGESTTGTNTVDVTDAGSKWSNSGGIVVGDGGNGALTVENNGLVTTAGVLVVGNSGSGSMTISNSGTVVSNGAQIGENTTGTNTVGVTGANSKWTNTGLFYVGDQGNGSLTVENGGTVTTTGDTVFGVGLYIGNGANATGTITVTGTGSSLSTINGSHGALILGENGHGTLLVENGGTVTTGADGYNGALWIGDNATGVGLLTVDGTGSSLTAGLSGAGDITVGDRGTGTMTISNGGVVTDANSDIGGSLTGSPTGTGGGMVDVTGTGSQWTNSGTVTVGEAGNGTLTVENSGTVTSSSVRVAFAAGSQGTLNLDSGGLLETGSVVAGSGTATFDFNGGILRATGNNTDFISGFNGTEISLESGGGTIDNNGYNITVNDSLTGSGDATFTGTGTTTLTATSSYTGTTTVSYGTLAVSGTSAAISQSSTVYVSLNNGDNSSLSISGGGAVSSGYAYIGNNSGSTGNVTVTGTGSQWTNSGTVTVGEAGDGSLTVENSGTVTSSVVRVAFAGGSTGTLNLDSGGVLETRQVVAGSGSATFDFNGGILRATGNNTDFISGFSGTEVNLESGGGTIDNNGYNITINTSISGTGGVTFTGTATTTLTATSTYSGGTTIAKGILETDSSNAVGTGTVIVDAGATLRIGNTNLANNITISGTGASSNAGTITGAATLSGTVSLVGDALVTKNGSGDFNLYAINLGSSTLTISGTIAPHTFYLNGNISGSGGLIINVNNAAIDGGQNTFTGTTDVLSGSNLALQDAAGTAIPGDLIIEDGAYVAASVDNQFGANTVITLSGTGILDIETKGTLSETIGGLSGTSTKSFVGSGLAGDTSVVTLTLSGTGFYSYAGQISDNPAADPVTLIKTGSGTQVLSGNNGYNGGTIIKAGTLVIGSATGLGLADVTLNGGTLTTTGTGTGLKINIGGNYTQTGGALLLNIYSATNYDSLNLTSGAATVGGTLDVNIAGAFAPGQGQSFNLITTGTTVIGTFSSVLTNLPSLSGTINYSNNVALIYQNSFVGLGIPLTPNQVAVATYIDTYDLVITNPAFGNLVGALNGISGSPSALEGAFNQLMPLNFANFASSTAFNNTSFVTQQLDGYLANHRGADGTFVSSDGGIDYTGLAINDPNIDSGLQGIRSRLLAWSPAPSTGLLSDSGNLVLGGVDMKDVAVQSGPTNLWNVFVTGNIILAQDFSDNSVGLPYSHTTTDAAQIGADYKITPHFLVGVTFGYGHTNANLDTLGSGAEVNTYSPGVYLSYANNGWYYNALGSYGFSSYSQNRNVNFGGFSGTAHSSPGGSQIVGNLDGGYDFHKGNWTFGPTLGLQYVHLDVDGYSETGLPGADLTVNENQADSLRSRLGGRISYAVKSGDLIFTPHLSASWQHEFMDQSRGITSQFNAVGAGSFVVNTPNPSRDSALVDVGLDAQVTNTLTVFTDYSAQAGQSNYFGQSVQAGVKIGF